MCSSRPSAEGCSCRLSRSRRLNEFCLHTRGNKVSLVICMHDNNNINNDADKSTFSPIILFISLFVFVLTYLLRGQADSNKQTGKLETGYLLFSAFWNSRRMILNTDNVSHGSCIVSIKSCNQKHRQVVNNRCCQVPLIEERIYQVCAKVLSNKS